ncbi:hypothetical protein PAXINDRAFT_8674, partial [Paxillus involutus ATCC 200175]
LRKQHRELEPPTWKWFGSGSDKSKKHLENSQKFLAQVKDTLETTIVTNARSECLSSTSTNRSFDTARASTCQPSINSQSLQDDMENTTAPPNPQLANTEASGSEIPSSYATALTDAMDTPLETSVAKTSDFSVLRPPSNKPAPLPTAQPKRQSPTTQSAAIKPASQPRPAPPSQPQLAAGMAKQAPSGKGARRPASRYNGFTHMSNCVTIDGFASADGLTIQRGGYGNTGSESCCQGPRRFDESGPDDNAEPPASFHVIIDDIPLSGLGYSGLL